MTNTVKLLKKRERDLPVAEYVDVTPELAAQWLALGARNRKISNRRVEMYAAMMARGDWMLTSQGISFDEFGKLIDGQHRLAAIAKAGVTVQLLVVRATSNRSQLVLDQGLRRTPQDQIALREGWDVGAIHVATAKSMIMSVGGAGETRRRAIIGDIQLLDRFYIRHHKAINWAVSRTWGHSTLRGVTVAPVIAPIARAYYTVDLDTLGRFAEVVVTGLSERPGEGPAVVLRNYLIAGREKSLSSRAGKDRFTIYKKTELALQAFLKGQSIQRLGLMTLEQELFRIPKDPVTDKE